LVYSNAGHNLPLWRHHATGLLSRLPKCGMALGVESNIQLEEHIFSVEPGDFVVFYTDGVTEAFAPEGAMYGEDRLHRTISESGNATATDIVEAIDRSVDEFTDDEFISDDLTLVVLKRGNS
jgi:sigma-B regulation protein RsbU (phosphoserine phosphatase)